MDFISFSFGEEAKAKPIPDFNPDIGLSNSISSLNLENMIYGQESHHRPVEAPLKLLPFDREGI